MSCNLKHYQAALAIYRIGLGYRLMFGKKETNYWRIVWVRIIFEKRGSLPDTFQLEFSRRKSRRNCFTQSSLAL